MLMKFLTKHWEMIPVKNYVNSLLCVSVLFLYSAGLSGLAKELLSDFADSLPGIDEAKSFMQVMGYVLAVTI